MENNFKKIFIITLVFSILASSIVGGVVGFIAGSVDLLNAQFSLDGLLKSFIAEESNNSASKKIVKVEEQSAIVAAVEKVSPAVVSIIVSKDLPIVERYYETPFENDFFRQFFGDGFGFDFNAPRYEQKGTEKKEVGGGTGFIISADGYIATNNHVVSDKDAEYTVLMNDGSKHNVKVLAQDSLRDFAILKIDGKNLPTVEIGDSESLKAGQTAIAIGNALGEFRNTVSVGVISGLSRSIIAGGSGGGEYLTGVIQTDASINPGNSGGPLLNLEGQVIGINTAIVQGAQNIGFAIPINEVKNDIESVRQHGRIIRPWLGVRYVLINKAVIEANNLAVDYGALITRGKGPADLAVIPGSPADKAGLEENDIIMEMNGKKIDEKNPLANAVGSYKPGDELTLKVLHKGEKKEVKVELEEMK